MEQWRATGSDIETLTDAEKGLASPSLSLRLTGRDMLTRPDRASTVTPSTLRADLAAGLTGASLVLPQGVAFASIAGLPPEYGFYTSIVPTVVAALTGSSWHAVTGATTALSALVFGALAGSLSPGTPDFIAAAVTMALLVGLFQILMGSVRLGRMVNFVSHPVMTGFVTGAALLIAFSQVGHAINVDLPRPESPLAFARALFAGAAQTDAAALAVTILAMAVGIMVRRLGPQLPHYLIALLAATALGAVLTRHGAALETVGTINSVVPVFAVPDLSPDLGRTIISGSFAVAFVGLLEAASIGRAMAMRSGRMFNANREFIGQGVANLAGSFFSSYPRGRAAPGRGRVAASQDRPSGVEQAGAVPGHQGPGARTCPPVETRRHRPDRPDTGSHHLRGLHGPHFPRMRQAAGCGTGFRGAGPGAGYDTSACGDADPADGTRLLATAKAIACIQERNLDYDT